MNTKHYFLLSLLCGILWRGSGITKNQEKVCVGNGHGVSTAADLDNDDYLYQSLKERFEGCTYVEGNLEVKFLRQKHYNMSFLKHIREVTGYVLILLVYPEIVSFPNLSVIRGTELYEGNALYVATTYHNRRNDTGIRELQFPSLHEILRGEVKFQDNRYLCYVHTIDWSDMREGLVPIFQDHGTFCTAEHVCTPECPGGCWGRDPSMCQKLTRKNCSGTCDYRCNGPTQADCCHRSCAAGCTGPSNAECLACLTFTMDDQCVEVCPPRTIYNPETFQNEPNPDFRYVYGLSCLTSCPDNVLEVDDTCTNECPAGTVESYVPGEKVCVDCGAHCRKVCDGVTDVLYGEDFADGKLTNCTIIRNNIFIGASSFEGDIFLGKRGITVDMLERLSTVREIKGYLVVQGRNERFTSLNFLRNLHTIRGRQLYGREYRRNALTIIHSSLQSLDLVGLKRVAHGSVDVRLNRELCYVTDQVFSGVEVENDVIVTMNADADQCSELGYVCDPECAPIGCWGPGPEQCARCLNAQIDNTCAQQCNTSSQYVVKQGSEDEPTVCAHCDPECLGSCLGPGPQNCTECKNVKDGPFCRAECPASKYPDESGICQPSCRGNCGVEMRPTTINSDVGDSANDDTQCPRGYRYDADSLRCIANCSEGRFVDNTSGQCAPCHRECLGGCVGGGRGSCLQCRNVQHDGDCLESCPDGYENFSGICKKRDALPVCLIVGVCIAVLVLLTLIAIVGYILHRKRNKSGYRQTSVDMDTESKSVKV